jgi:two-component system response regulator YesN
LIKIVIVEDEYRVRHGLSQLINKLETRCKVVGEAENGYEGLMLIQDIQPDVVITDIKMPKMDGLEMIKRVSDMKVNTKFIILSGHAEFELAQAGLRLGAYDYLLKPVTITKVKELLEGLTDGTSEKLMVEEEKYSKIVQDMKETIDSSYGLRLSLSSFAEKYRMTPEYISGLFAKEIGVTYSDYIKEVRIEKAKELLTNSNLKVYEVACQVGYPDQKYFSKIFKDYTGISAKQYAMNCHVSKTIE